METPDEIIERQGQMIVKQADRIAEARKLLQRAGDRISIRAECPGLTAGIDAWLSEKEGQS